MPAAARLCLPDIPVTAVCPGYGFAGLDVGTHGERLLSRAHVPRAGQGVRLARRSDLNGIVARWTEPDGLAASRAKARAADRPRGGPTE
jgi:hypothetical protein